MSLDENFVNLEIAPPQSQGTLGFVVPDVKVQKRISAVIATEFFRIVLIPADVYCGFDVMRCAFILRFISTIKAKAKKMEKCVLIKDKCVFNRLFTDSCA